MIASFPYTPPYPHFLPALTSIIFLVTLSWIWLIFLGVWQWWWEAAEEQPTIVQRHQRGWQQWRLLYDIRGRGLRVQRRRVVHWRVFGMQAQGVNGGERTRPCDFLMLVQSYELLYSFNREKRNVCLYDVPWMCLCFVRVLHKWPLLYSINMKGDDRL